MPVKRRRPKRRLNETEGAAWSELFRSGKDFFHELEAIGIRDQTTAQRTARMAWRRYGARFLAGWEPDLNIQTPWALEKFGPPNS